MNVYKTESPVLMIVFNRPDKAQKVLSAIRTVAPKKLYIAADGPRPGHPTDADQCKSTREIVNQVDWDCEVKTLFQPKNLGCGLAVSTGISWFFHQEEKGIILEDDCLPNIDFFRFCDELLDKYQHDTRVMQVSGTNYHKGWKRDADYSYYFSSIGHCWGWATWRRAWNHFDLYMKKYPELKSKGYMDDYVFKDVIAYFAALPNIEQETWDVSWDFAKYSQSGLSIIPHANMVKNIGLDGDSTHEFEGTKYKLEYSKEDSFPLKHPSMIIPDTVSDHKYYQEYWGKSRIEKIKMAVKKMIPKNIWGMGKNLYQKLKTANA